MTGGMYFDSHTSENFPPLTAVCEDCDGVGHEPGDFAVPCRSCRGHGKLLTRFGDEVLDFVRSHAREIVHSV